MPDDADKPAVKERSDDWNEVNPVQAEAQTAAERLDRITESLSELHKAWEDLKARIAEARRRNEMPIDSALRNPNFEQDAADERLDVPNEEDEK